MFSFTGYPDFGTLRIVKLLGDLNLPILGLFDFDPYGFDIFSVYKWGSISKAYCNDILATNSIRWLGIHFEDFENQNITLLQLSMEDVSYLKSIIKREPFKYERNFQYLYQLERMLESGKKSEIQAFSQKSLDFLSKMIGEKLENKRFI